VVSVSAADAPGTARRLFVLQLGGERVPDALSLRGGGPRLSWEPIAVVVVETPSGWVLLDTGMGRAALDSPAVQGAYAAGRDPDDDVDPDVLLTPSPPDPHAWTWGLPGEPLVAGLASIGLQITDLAIAAVSHLHVDHSGGIPLLADAGVPVAIHADELAFARSAAARVEEGFHAPDWSHPATQWRVLDGDADLAPGVRVLATPGHTPGHVSFRVDLPQTGTWLFPCDAADLAQNLLQVRPCGSCAGGTAEEEAAAERSLHRLLAEAAETDGRLVPTHDQVVVNAVRHPPGGHG
jgi:glyoxylase-like metal-dependent hydrolase (beta-lactamase superfamily II)